METIRGKRSLELDYSGLRERLAGYNRILLDLGTGDGRYVRYQAERQPDWFVIGIDTCRENLHEHSRAKLTNMLFIVAGAQGLPHELSGLVSHLTINFPWGSLLEGLLAADPALMDGLALVAGPVTSVEVRLNSGALAEAGRPLEGGANEIRSNLLRYRWLIDAPHLMEATALQTFPSTWARRLAFGRDPWALALQGWLADRPQTAQ
jgi:16S rRNA (adenine(1408)-N(1))-methyltransferase